MNILEVVEGTQKQGIDEAIVWKVDTSNWGNNPTSVSVKAYINTNHYDVTETIFPTNAPTVGNNIITLSPAQKLSWNIVYRIEIQFNSGSNTFECFFKLEGV